MNAGSPYVQVRETLQQLVRTFGSLQKDGAQGCGISVAHSHILYELSKRPNISLNDLAQLLATDTSSLSRQVQQLVELELVARIPDSNDRRYVVLSLTPKGEQEQQQIAAAVEACLQNLFKHIPAKKHEQTFETMKLLSDAIRSGQSLKEPPS